MKKPPSVTDGGFLMQLFEFVDPVQWRIETVKVDGLSRSGEIRLKTGEKWALGRTLDDQFFRTGAHGGQEKFLFVHARNFQLLNHL